MTIDCGELLGLVVQKICIKSGLTTDDIDIGELTDRVKGYTVKDKKTTRSSLEPLMTAYQFDACFEDDKLVFKKKKGIATIDIPEDDLSADEYGSNSFSSFPTKTKNKIELPTRSLVFFRDSEMDYLENSQEVSRKMTVSQNKVTIETPVVMTSTTAKQLADTLMSQAWITRYSHTLKVSNKYAAITPTDVITVTMNNGTVHTLRVLNVEKSASGVITLQTVNEDSTVYTSNAVAVDGDWVAQELEVVPGVYILLLDIPMLRSADTNSGIYYAVYADNVNFRGINLYKSSDDVTYSIVSQHGTPSTAGTTSDALADGPTTLIDTGNTVTVVLDSYGLTTLTTITEAQMLDGGNLAIIGSDDAWEIIQFQTATVGVPGTYTLSNLVRGRFGTEQHTSTHAISDRFVLLDTSTIKRLGLDEEDIGTSFYWKVGHFGASESDLTSFTFTNDGENFKPYPPTHIAGTRDASGNLTITWQRRTRYGGEWKDYADAPLNEAFEVYEVDIMNGASVVRTISSVTETASYTVTEQTTDFGSTQSSLDVEIYQISDKVGRGNKGEATI